jgi:hypothetical protein
MFFRVAGIWGASEISFFVLGCLSRYIAASVVLFLVFWVYIRCCGNGYLWFRLTATHFFYKRLKKVSKKTLAPTYGPRRLGSLRSGIDLGAAATVCFAAPTSAVSGCARRSLRSHARINPSTQPSDVAGGSRSKAGELTLGLLSGEKRGCSAFDLRCCCPSPQPSPEGEGADLLTFQSLSSTRYFASAYLAQTPRSVPSPSGRGLG